ncbi:MAG: hypothetical protein ACYTBJ_21675 [Planctomycetota bacterium]
MIFANKRATFLVLVGCFCLVFVVSSVSEGVSTKGIDAVRGKGVLNRGDFEIIDRFLSEAVDELVKAKEPSSIVNVRTTISQRKGSKEPSALVQYSTKFSDSAQKYIAGGLEQASGFEGENRRLLVTVNLLILVDHLEYPGLADLAVGKLMDEKAVVRYWAVHAITKPAMITAIQKGNDSRLAQRIASQLTEALEKSGHEEIALMAGFAAAAKSPEAEELLIRIADRRIKEYADWSVEYELLEADVLKALCEGMSSTGGRRTEIAQRFGQLYSYAIQRYVKGQVDLSDTQRQQLISVLVETEDKCLGKLLGQRQGVIKSAIGRNDTASLLREHDRLLGSGTTAGVLVPNYGPNPGGRQRAAPLVLPDPPRGRPSE